MAARSEREKKAVLAVLMAALTSVIVAVEIKKKERKTQPRYLRPALVRPIGGPAVTAWRQLLACGTARDFIVALNFPRELLLEKVLPHFERVRLRISYGSPYRKGPKRRGRGAQMRSIDLLGLALWYLKSRCTTYSLCPIFGLVPSSVYIWLDYALEVLWRVVRKRSRKEFEIRWPSFEEIKLSAALLERNRDYGTLLRGVFAIVDGGRMPTANYTDSNLQNAYFEGFTQNEEVTNLFVFNFFGEIIHGAINFPGSWHDNRLAAASGLYWPKLSDSHTPAGYAILGDSAFVTDVRCTNGKVLRGRKSNEKKGIPQSAVLAAVDILLQRAMPSERQSAEWGIRAIKGPFSRLKVPLPADSMKRLRLIQTCCHLYNFRVRFVGLNQIRSTYADDNEETQPWLEYLE